MTTVAVIQNNGRGDLHKNLFYLEQLKLMVLARSPSKLTHPADPSWAQRFASGAHQAA